MGGPKRLTRHPPAPFWGDQPSGDPVSLWVVWTAAGPRAPSEVFLTLGHTAKGGDGKCGSQHFLFPGVQPTPRMLSGGREGMQMAKGPFPPGGDVGLGTIVCDCHSLAVCIPEKLSPRLFQLAWVLALSFTVLITGRSRQMKNSLVHLQMLG